MVEYEISSLPQAILAEINANRNIPQLVLPCYTERLQHFNKFSYSYSGNGGSNDTVDTVEGEAAVTEYIDFLSSQKSLPALSLHVKLSEAAEETAINLLNKLTISDIYDNYSDEPLEERISKYFNWKNMVGECINVGCTSGVDIAAALLIDDGNEERTNRRLLFHKDAKYIGIGCASNETYKLITVILLSG